MTRFSATGAIFITVVWLVSGQPAAGQSSRGSAADGQCFPWQELQDGRCVAKASPLQPPLLPSAASPPCDGGARNLSEQCTCPAATHRDPAGGNCISDAAPGPQAPKPAQAVACEGGTANNGGCTCPAGSKLIPAAGNAGGTCVRTDAENCQGGELTASGTCLCSGEVVMSGETYLLEYSNGKCLPTRCPVATALKDGRCVATSAVTAAPAQAMPAKETSEEEEAPHRGCAHGMIRARAGCVPVRRRAADSYGEAEARVRRYYRAYEYPGYRIGLPPN